ncbi:hypothetical protein FA15DRAFT_752670 [Coprinopsis marcescibilis]|uniref:Uncharacterized protein n=1 Tax=Coprinopsis marcescibilis TaxID=230819 RepID=A0A5C3L944_COPMA|nr:hypothetical protein FA15DRAFT_752670 [Coprinopsis marcescibilis]
MLKRSLGDRTWNAGEISSELRRLNEDVQTFLSLHTIKTLDLIRTSQSEQYDSIANSMEEIITKITGLDASMKPPILAQVIPRSLLGLPLRTSIPSYGNNTRNVNHVGIGSMMSRVRVTSQSRDCGDDPSSKMEQNFEQNSGSTLPIDHGSDEDMRSIVDKLKSVSSLPIQVSGLKRPAGNETYSETFVLKSDAKYTDVSHAVMKAGYVPPDEFEEDNIVGPITVADGDSVYDAKAPGGLQISKSEPLMWWRNKYDEYHNLAPREIPMKTDLSWNRESVTIDKLEISFHRTLRVPDNESKNALPPSLGKFPLFSVAQLGSNVPDSIKNRGGFITPMFRREALWISFSARYHARGPAVKVSVGGVNVISGATASEPTPLEISGHQDYIVPDNHQSWLDGIVVGPGVVRQFVITNMGKGYTVEEQITGEAKVGGIQLDVYPRRTMPSGRFQLHIKPPNAPKPGNNALSITLTPQELGLQVGDTIENFSFPRDDFSFLRVPQDSWTLSSYTRRMPPRESLCNRLKARYIKPSRQHTIYEADHSTFLLHAILDPPSTTRPGLMDTKRAKLLGIAAGGQIAQKIYRDKSSIRHYNANTARRFHLHIVSPELWENITGVLPPITPITREMYLKYSIPWFKLYDDYVDGITETSEALSSVISVSKFDEIRLASRSEPASGSIDPDSPPFCPKHKFTRASSIFRPCGLCLGTAMLGGSRCGHCGSAISRFIGMKDPIPHIAVAEEENEDGDHWDVQEIEGVSLNAVQSGVLHVIHLKQDDVGPLHQWD